MKPRSPRSMELFQVLLDRGYPPEFSDLITRNLNTDFTANRMLGYLSYYSYLPEAEIVDEMLSILSDRNQIMKKKDMEETNALLNDLYRDGLPEE